MSNLYIAVILTARKLDAYAAADGIVEVYALNGRVYEIPKTQADSIRATLRV